MCVVWFSTSHCLAAETDVGETGGSESCGEWLTFQLCNRQHDSPVKRECWDAHLFHERIPPSCLLEVHLYGYSWELSWLYHISLHLFRDRAASDQGPGHHTATYGFVAARRPPMKRTTNHACTATSIALGTPRTCQPGTLRIARMALLTEQARGGVRHL